jgi:putative sigma-54 modulation protein
MRTVILLLDGSHVCHSAAAIILSKRKIMNIIIESPHLESSQIPETLIRKKINHLDKFFDRIEYCKVVLQKEKSNVQNSCFIEAIVKVPSNLLFSSDTSGSFEITLDKVIHDLEVQLHRYKEKLQKSR